MSEKQKYVKIVTSGYPEFIVFPTSIEHSSFKGLNPVSAGFCYVGKNKVTCYGDSFSLSLESDENDTVLATKQFCGWESVKKLNK